MATPTKAGIQHATFPLSVTQHRNIDRVETSRWNHQRLAPGPSAITYCVRIGPASGYGCRVTDDKTPSRPRFLTIEQVADELTVGLPTVRMLLKSGELRGMQIGGRGMWRIATTDLEDYIEQAYRLTAERIAAGEVPDEDPAS